MEAGVTGARDSVCAGPRLLIVSTEVIEYSKPLLVM